MRQKAYHILSVLTMGMLGLWYGCTKENEGNAHDSSPQAIAFTPMEIKTTRAAQTTLSNLSSYGVSCSKCPTGASYTSVPCGSFFFNLEVAAETGTTDYYWPSSDEQLSFFAYAPYGAEGLTLLSSSEVGYPSYSYTVPSNITHQVDFITANVLNRTRPTTTDPIPLTFNHQCADVRWNVYNQGSTSLTVHSITIAGVKYSGTCKGDTWTLNPAVNSLSDHPFTLATNTVVEGKATVDYTGTTNHFIMLPQTVAAGTQLLDVYATVDGITQHYYYSLDASLTFEAGKAYTFTLTLGMGELIVDEETDITDWEVETKYLMVKTISSNNTWTQPSVNEGEVLGVADWTEEE